jgi:hypothetical protein
MTSLERLKKEQAMPAIKCSNGKWKWGENGQCVFSSKTNAEIAGKAIEAKKSQKKRKYK